MNLKGITNALNTVFSVSSGATSGTANISFSQPVATTTATTYSTTSNGAGQWVTYPYGHPYNPAPQQPAPVSAPYQQVYPTYPQYIQVEQSAEQLLLSLDTEKVKEKLKDMSTVKLLAFIEILNELKEEATKMAVTNL
jgi:hypothetical protein